MPQGQKKIQAQNQKKTIEDKVQRINIKSKRKRTLLRKAIEVSQLCSLDILIIIRDNETSKLIEYSSGKSDDQLFTFNEAVRSKMCGKYMPIYYNDNSYNHLTPCYKLKAMERNNTKRIEEAEMAL